MVGSSRGGIQASPDVPGRPAGTSAHRAAGTGTEFPGAPLLRVSKEIKQLLCMALTGHIAHFPIDKLARKRVERELIPPIFLVFHNLGLLLHGIQHDHTHCRVNLMVMGVTCTQLLREQYKSKILK